MGDATCCNSIFFLGSKYVYQINEPNAIFGMSSLEMNDFVFTTAIFVPSLATFPTLALKKEEMLTTSLTNKWKETKRISK